MTEKISMPSTEAPAPMIWSFSYAYLLLVLSCRCDVRDIIAQKRGRFHISSLKVERSVYSIILFITMKIPYTHDAASQTGMILELCIKLFSEY
jgi:hypothetical protein